MKNRELLELAAKAAGYKHEVTPIDPQPNRPAYWSNWNPLTNDGDALRLAVKLGMTVKVDTLSGFSWVKRIEGSTPHSNDPYAATRRAIVRAAAEIGKEMK